MDTIGRRLGLIALGVLAVLLVLWLLLARPWGRHRAPEPLPSPVDPQQLAADVMALAVEFYPRSFRHPDNLNAAADYVSSRLAGADLSEQHYDIDGRRYRNIIAAYGPETREVVIVGAHYDSFGDTPGADDNASGVAGLLALGTLLAKTELASRVLLVAYSTEEPPFFAGAQMGSWFHARQVQQQGLSVRLMIGLEMIGYFRDEPGSQDYPNGLLSLFYPGSGHFIALVDQLWSDAGRQMRTTMAGGAMPVYSVNAPRFIPGVDYSDHMNYWDRGYPAVMVTDTAFYRNPHYHGAGDTPATLDYQRMAAVVAGVYRHVRRLANRTE